MLLLNRVALITGGAKGIGKGMALKFAEEGCSVAIADISVKDANETINEIEKIGREGLFVECNVTDSGQLSDMVKQVIEKFGKIDILVNNAGTLLHVADPNLKSIATIPENEWDKLLAINLKGTFLTSKAVVPFMKEKRYGKIINITSLGAVYPPAVAPHYNSAKAGVMGLTYDMACELGPFNITVNAIMPGLIRTSFYEPVLKTKTDEEKEEFFKERSKNIPLQRAGTAEDVACVALFLASELSAYVTAAILPVTGGLPFQPNF
ncbi:MAG TPA: SDR family oxidoreductase [Firmicutes bacterium]|nr:SDR family oxidoreductase [Bacillota bacterium]